MSEVCRTCPIAEADPDSPLLNAAAAERAGFYIPGDNLMVYAKSDTTAEETLDEETGRTLDEALGDLGFSPRKIRLAKKCAEKIKWAECEFHSADI